MTREDILNPNKIPCTNWLRWVITGEPDPELPTTNPQFCGRKLQRYTSTRGEWIDVPVFTEEELREAGRL